MAPGDIAAAYIKEHEEDKVPETGKPPVIVEELKLALNEGKGGLADAVVENYRDHGRIAPAEGYRFSKGQERG